jgi:hypothetical protein
MGKRAPDTPAFLLRALLHQLADDSLAPGDRPALLQLAEDAVQALASDCDASYDKEGAR